MQGLSLGTGSMHRAMRPQSAVRMLVALKVRAEQFVYGLMTGVTAVISYPPHKDLPIPCAPVRRCLQQD